MTTPINPEKITQLLNEGTKQLDRAALDALAEARQRALAMQPERIAALASATGGWVHHLVPHTIKQWLITGLLAALLAAAGATYWQNHNTEEQLSELDVAILADEMPLEVFVN
jgi:hypothetical protein